MVHTYNSSTQEVEAGRKRVWSQSVIQSKIKVSLRYITRPSQKTSEAEDIALSLYVQG